MVTQFILEEDWHTPTQQAFGVNTVSLGPVGESMPRVPIPSDALKWSSKVISQAERPPEDCCVNRDRNCRTIRSL